MGVEASTLQLCQLRVRYFVASSLDTISTDFDGWGFYEDQGMETEALDSDCMSGSCVDQVCARGSSGSGDQRRGELSLVIHTIPVNSLALIHAS